VVRAHVLLMRRDAVVVPDPAEPLAPLPPPDACAPYAFPFFTADVGYQTSMELRLISGTFGRGHMALWFRLRVAVVHGEVPTPLQRVAAAADSGNGVSVGLDLARYTFVNPDLSIALLRPPEGEWFALDARTLFGAAGSGIADTQLHDAEGVLGRSVQTLLVEARGLR
jgi:hypothetical protein